MSVTRGSSCFVIALLASLILSCGSLDAEDDASPDYRLSEDPATEVLYLTSYGGSGPLAAQYRLFGDRRMVRELVDKASREPRPEMTQVLMLEPGDVDLVMSLVVAGRLSEMTPERLHQALGRRPLRMHDGATYMLRLYFESYSLGDEVIEPYAAEVRMHAPRLQARAFPEVREVEGMNSLIETIDDFFPESVGRLIYGSEWKGD